MAFYVHFSDTNSYAIVEFQGTIDKQVFDLKDLVLGSLHLKVLPFSNFFVSYLYSCRMAIST